MPYLQGFGEVMSPTSRWSRRASWRRPHSVRPTRWPALARAHRQVRECSPGVGSRASAQQVRCGSRACEAAQAWLEDMMAMHAKTGRTGYKMGQAQRGRRGREGLRRGRGEAGHPVASRVVGARIGGEVRTPPAAAAWLIERPAGVGDLEQRRHGLVAVQFARRCRHRCAPSGRPLRGIKQASSTARSSSSSPTRSLYSCALA